jgi:DNA-binding transcriptional LysR family regulator
MGVPRRPADLQSHPCLVTHTRFGDGCWRFTGPEGPVDVKVTGPITPSNAITMRFMVLEGAGIALLPNFAIADDLAQGSLIRVLPDYRVPDLPIAAFYPHRELQPKKTRLFLDYAARELRRAPWHRLT